MQVRDAVDDDADALGKLSDEPVDAERLVRDRAVRVAERDDEVCGFVAFDTWQGAVHITRLVGDPDAVERLLEEPLTFAEREGLPVEVVLPESDDLRGVVEDVDFEEVGPGPRFQNEPTRRYRKEIE